MTIYLTNLAGLSFRPAEAKTIVRELEVGAQLRLEREGDNPHDSNAIRIYRDRDFLGYVEKLTNAPIAEEIDNFISDERPLPYSAVVKAVYPDQTEGRVPGWMRPLIEIKTGADAENLPPNS